MTALPMYLPTLMTLLASAIATVFWFVSLGSPEPVWVSWVFGIWWVLVFSSWVESRFAAKNHELETHAPKLRACARIDWRLYASTCFGNNSEQDAFVQVANLFSEDLVYRASLTDEVLPGIKQVCLHARRLVQDYSLEIPDAVFTTVASVLSAADGRAPTSAKVNETAYKILVAMAGLDIPETDYVSMRTRTRAFEDGLPLEI